MKYWLLNLPIFMDVRNPLLSIMGYYTNWLIEHNLHFQITWRLSYSRLINIQYIE